MAMKRKTEQNAKAPTAEPRILLPHKRSVMARILLFIGIPVAVVYLLVAQMVLHTVKTSQQETSTQILENSTQLTAAKIDKYFSAFLSSAEQLASSRHITLLMDVVGPSGSFASYQEFTLIRQTLRQMYELHMDAGAYVAWIADLDSGQMAHSDGMMYKDVDITQRPWYAAMEEQKHALVTDPYDEPISGQHVVSVVAPVFKSGTTTVIGVVGIDFNSGHLQNVLSSYKLGETGFYMLSSSNGQVVLHPDTAYLHTYISESNLPADMQAAILAQEARKFTYPLNGERMHSYISPVGELGWTLTSTLPDREFNETYRTVQKVVMQLFAVGLLIVAALTAAVSQSIVRPLKKLTLAATQIAEGKLDVEVESTSADEVGRVAQAVQRTARRLRRYIGYIAEVRHVLESMARGDMRITLTQDYAGGFLPVKHALQEISASLNNAFRTIQNSSSQVNAGAMQVANAAQSLSEGAMQEAADIEELQSSIALVASMANENLQNVEQAMPLFHAVSDGFQVSNEHMRQMLVAMERITASSAKISGIAKTVGDIAFQTNILSLNAAIEAARAGAAGKGFAVVADEVRLLATKSSQAAKQTEELIEDSLRAIDDTAGKANHTAKLLNDLGAQTAQTTDIVGKIRDASLNQARFISQITDNIGNISSVSQNNASIAQQSSAASEELLAQAALLQQEVQRFVLAEDETPSAEGPVYAMALTPPEK